MNIAINDCEGPESSLKVWPSRSEPITTIRKTITITII